MRFDSHTFRNTPVIKRSYIKKYISLEEFRKCNKYDKKFLNLRPKIKSKQFLWIDSLISESMMINNSLIVKKLIQNARYFSIKKHPNEKLSDLAKNMLSNGSEYIDLSLPLELYIFENDTKFVSPTFSTLLNSSKIVIPNHRISLVKIFLGEDATTKYQLKAYENKIEFLDSSNYVSKLFRNATL